MRRILPVAVASLSGLVVLVGYFGGSELLGGWPSLILEAAAFLSAVALLMGTAHLAGVHGRRALRRDPGGGYSAVLLTALLATFGIGVALPGSQALTWVFEYLYTPLQATMTALLAFFLVSGAYRAFRVRSTGALVLLVTSLFLLLAQLPLSQRLSPLVPALRDWLLALPVTAGVRGILLGVALGTMAAALRLLTGVDRPQAQE